MSTSGWLGGHVRQLVGLITVSTVLLTASFVGIYAFLTGATEGLSTRLPFYVLLMAISFVAGVVGLTRYRADGATVLSAATGIGFLTFLLGVLAGEGTAYAIRAPAEVFASTLLVYFVAAGLIGTGLSFWTVHYWREFTAVGGTSSSL